jgi:hypothetical protein
MVIQGARRILYGLTELEFQHVVAIIEERYNW